LTVWGIISRIESFNEIYKNIVEDNDSFDLFNYQEKRIYQDFVKVISDSLSKRESSANLLMNNEKLIKQLDELKQKTILEDYINVKHLLKIFINGQYRFYNNSFSTSKLKDFIQFFKSISKEKQNIVIYNIETRFTDIDTYFEYDDEDIPF